MIAIKWLVFSVFRLDKIHEIQGKFQPHVVVKDKEEMAQKQ